MALHKFSFPTEIHFGAGVRARLPEHLKGQNVRRPLLVTDRGLAPLPLIREMKQSMENAGLEVEVFSGIFGNPVKSQVEAGVKAFRDHRSDAVIGVGGGAALDVAKAIALMIHHPGDLFDYEDEKPGARPIDRDIPYWVGVPTTSGTGSEVGRSSVISDDQTHVKKVIFSPRLLAKAVFADPELTVGLPPKITAATGMDALTHCVEAYLAKGYHPICDGIALEGIRLVAESLVRAVKEPENIEARTSMMMASMMGAIAFQKGLGVTHSCAHALSTVADLHHGLANGILIDHVMRLNLPAVPERFRTMARMIGLASDEPEGFIRWLQELKSQIGIPAKLSGAGVKPEQLDELCRLARQDGCHLNNPKPCEEADFRAIFAQAI